MRAVRITVAVGLTLLAGALAIAVSRSPAAVARANSAPANAKLGSGFGDSSVCQAGETLPAGTSAIRLLIHSPVVGPRVTVEVLQGERVLTSGARGSGWTAGTVTVPVRPLSRTISGTTACFTFERSPWAVGLTGRLTPPSVAATSSGQTLPGRVGIEYLRAGHESWWSRILSIGRQIGLGHAGGGALIPLLVLALMVSLVGLSSWLAVRELG